MLFLAAASVGLQPCQFRALLPTLLRQPEKTAAHTFLLNYVGFTQKNQPRQSTGLHGVHQPARRPVNRQARIATTKNDDTGNAGHLGQHLVSRGQACVVGTACTAVDGTGKALAVGVLHEGEEHDDQRSDQQDRAATIR